MENAKEEKRKMCDDWRRRPNDRELATDSSLCYYITINNSALLSQGEGQGDGGKKRGKKANEWRSPLAQTKPPQTTVFSSGSHGECQAINSTSPGFFFFKWYHCSILIVVALFVRASWEGGIKKKIRQFDGCLLISRPLRLWLPNIKPAITDQSSHLHLHTPNSWIGSN